MTSRSSRYSRRLAGAFVLFWAGFSAPASAASIERLMVASGLHYTLTQVPAAIAVSMDAPQPGLELPQDVRIALKDAAAQSFRAEELIESVRSRLVRDLAEPQVLDLLSWFEAPLGMRITALEMKASDPAAMRQIEAYAAELQQHPPAQSRLALMQAINAATESTESAAAIMQAIALATALGMNAAQPKQAQVPAEILRQKIKDAMPQLQAQADAIVIVSLHYTYRELPDAELAQYLSFLQSAAGAAYARSGSNAMREALTHAIGRFMLAIPKALERSRGSGRA